MSTLEFQGALRVPEQVAPGTPATGTVLLYAKADGNLYQKDDAGTETVLAGGGAGVTDGDKGDITVTGTGATWTIDSNVVTYAKMQDVSAASRVLGRGSAGGAGDPQELTLGASLIMNATAIERAALTGDVTASQNSNATTIANDAVTYAKIQNVTVTDRLLGRDTAAAGDVEEISVGGGIEFTGSLGIQTSAFTGDVTKTAGGTALTVANDAVTYAKMQNISAASRVLGRGSAGGAGDTQELTLGASLVMNGTVIERAALTGDATSAQNSNAIALTWPMTAADGSAANPSYSFDNSTGSGMYYTGTANTIGFATGGTLRLSIDTNRVTSLLPYIAPDGSTGAPGFAFSGSHTTGLFRNGNDVTFVHVGTSKMSIGATAVNVVDALTIATDHDVQVMDWMTVAP